MITGTKTLQASLVDIDATIPVLDVKALPALSPASRTDAKAARRLARRIERRRFVRLEQHLAAVAHLAPLPEPGEILHGVMDGRFSGWSLATAVIELLAEPIDELVISTLGFNKANADSLVALLDAGTVRSVLLNVSNYFRHSDREIFGRIRHELESRGQRVGITRSHAKLLLLKTARRHIVIETSANLRSSQNWEQFAISDDAELFAFHKAWLEDLIRSSIA